LRGRAGPDSSFVAAWSEAQAAGRTTAWFTAIDEAIGGREVPYYYRGKLCGTKRVYNDRLLIAALNAGARVRAQAGAETPNRDAPKAGDTSA
jgi:hypothetical protein